MAKLCTFEWNKKKVTNFWLHYLYGQMLTLCKVFIDTFNLPVKLFHTIDKYSALVSELEQRGLNKRTQRFEEVCLHSRQWTNWPPGYRLLTLHIAITT